ncbi:hypothetical protein KAR91_40125 [Candidatus Pacearchaeota archaeon]|nr:hypothetical protein [Candidatus Pacearchaeota archaeon]
MPEVAHETPEAIRDERIKNEFLQRLKNPNEWSGLRSLAFSNQDISFIDEVAEAYRYLLEAGEFKSCENFPRLRKLILFNGDKEEYDKIDFFSIADEVARKVLQDGNVELAKRIQSEFSNGKEMLVDCQREAKEGLRKRLDSLLTQFEEVGIEINRQGIMTVLGEE